MSLAYENNQDWRFVTSLFISWQRESVDKYLKEFAWIFWEYNSGYDVKTSLHESKDSRENWAGIVAEIMHRTFCIEKITGKRTESGEANQTGTRGPTWPKPTRRWILTSINQQRDRERKHACRAEREKPSA